MKKTSTLLLSLLILSSLILAGCNKEKPATIDKAVAVLYPIKSGKLRGVIKFIKKEDGLHTSGIIKGLPVGTYKLNINEFGDLIDIKAKTMGTVYNPTNSKEKPLGSLGTIDTNNKGVAYINRFYPNLKLNGDVSIIGRSLILSNNSEIYKETIAVGVIGRSVISK